MKIDLRLRVDRVEVGRQQRADVIAIDFARDERLAELGIGDGVEFAARAEPIDEVGRMVGQSRHVAGGYVEQMFRTRRAVGDAAAEWAIAVDDDDAQRFVAQPC